MNKDELFYKPGIVVWEVTLKCNLKCLHCGSSAGEKRPDELTADEALDLVRDLAEIGFQGIALMGGEVFLRKDWKKIGREIKDSGMNLSIITNGFFKPDKIIKDLVSLNADCVMVGIDGATAEIQDSIRNMPGSYEKAWDFVISAKKAGLPSGVITTVHKLNVMDLPKIKEKILEKEVDWQIQPAGVIGRFPEALMLSEEEYYSLGLFIHSAQIQNSNKKFSIVGSHNFGFHSSVIPDLSMYPKWEGCYAGKTVLGIQSNGNIKGCLAMPDELIEENIRKRDIKDIWADPKSFSYNRNFIVKDLGNNCNNCKYDKSCKGGCVTRSYSLTGKSHNDPNCFYRYEKENNLIKKSDVSCLLK